MKKKKVDTEKLEEQLKRALADYDNLHKRIEKERLELSKKANEVLVLKLLPVFDMLNEVQEHIKDSGLAIALREFEEVLASQGIEKVEAKQGDQFDQELHEVVEVVKGPKNGQVVKVILTGWRFRNGPVIRPVKVKVSRKEKIK
jgi:molecular chaperone GrpE